MSGGVFTAVVVGASGGVGGALASALASRGVGTVHALSRSGAAPPSTKASLIDVTDEDSVAAAAARIGGPVDLVFVATGLLHGPGVEPERTYRAMTADALARSFAVNAIGPALVAKHFLPLLPRQGRSVFACLSARVGSISDNRLGGWYAYRASKAALNMLVRTLSVELARTNPEAVCVALHPGTVDTALSRPFQRNVRPGGLFSADQSADHLLRVIDGLTPAQSGGCFAWDGQAIAP